MSQPSDKPTEKRADQLRMGDRIHDGRGIGPVEVAYVQPHRNAHGDQRVLVVTEDAAVSYHPVDELFTLGTEAEFAEAERQRERIERIADIRAFADWLEAHPDVPAPNGLRGQASLFGPWLDQLDVLERAAKALGLTVERKKGADGRPTGSVRLEVGKTDFVVYGSDDLRTGGRRCEHCGEDLDLIEAGRLGHVPGEACDPAPVLGGETPLDSLPEDFGADHQPEADCCEDCDAELDDADAAEMDADAEGVPAYADSVNGEEL